MQLHVDAGRFLKGVFNDCDVVDLTAHVEMQQPQFAEEIGIAQGFHRGEDFRHRKTEFGFVAHGAAPAAGAATGEAGTDADERGRPQGSAGFDDPWHFVGLFDHDNGASPQTPRQDRGFDVATVFVAVADQQGFRVVDQGQRDQQFGLAARLQAEMPALAAAHQLFHHVPLLIALHREHALVAAAVAVLGDGPFEGGVEAFQSVFEDVVEANEQRQVEVAALEPLHQIHKIEAAAAFSAGLHTHVPAKVDGEVRVSPPLEAIQLCTVLNAPSLRRSGSHGVRLTAQGVGVGEHHAV